MKYSTKAIIVVAMLFSAALSANAQFEDNCETTRFHLGIRGGLSANTLTGDVDGVNPLYFFTGGLAFDAQIASIPIFIGWGLNYLNAGYEYEIRGNKYTYNYKWDDAHSLHIPLVVGYHFNVAPNLFISPFIGGFASYNLKDADEEWDKDRFNYGLRIGCGLNFGRLTFDLAYDYGLKKLWDYTDKSIHTGTFFATIGVNFVGSR